MAKQYDFYQFGESDTRVFFTLKVEKGDNNFEDKKQLLKNLREAVDLFEEELGESENAVG